MAARTFLLLMFIQIHIISHTSAVYLMYYTMKSTSGMTQWQYNTDPPVMDYDNCYGYLGYSSCWKICDTFIYKFVDASNYQSFWYTHAIRTAPGVTCKIQSSFDGGSTWDDMFYGTQINTFDHIRVMPGSSFNRRPQLGIRLLSPSGCCYWNAIFLEAEHVPTTAAPTLLTSMPSVAPTHAPSTAAPTGDSNEPTATPSSMPTTAPTLNPTFDPSTAPSTASVDPTATPSYGPTIGPTHPSPAPTGSTSDPSITPTTFPTVGPSKQPSITPTTFPTVGPSEQPSITSITPIAPSKQPTANPFVATLSTFVTENEGHPEHADNNDADSLVSVLILVAVIGSSAFFLFFVVKCIYDRVKGSSHTTEQQIAAEMTENVETIGKTDDISIDDLYRKPLEQWQDGDVYVWLSLVNKGTLKGLAEILRAQRVKGSHLEAITEEMLKEFGIKLGDRMEFEMVRGELFAKYAPPGPGNENADGGDMTPTEADEAEGVAQTKAEGAQGKKEEEDSRSIEKMYDETTIVSYGDTTAGTV